MDQRGELAVAPGRQPQPLPSLGAIGGDGEALRARRDQPHRASKAFGGDGDPSGARAGRALRAKAAADETGNGADQVRLHPQLFRHGAAQAVHALAWFVDRQPWSVPNTGRREEFDGVVVLRRRRIARVDLHWRGGEGGVGVADARVLVLLGDFAFGLDAGAVKACARLLSVIFNLDPIARLSRRLETVGDDDSDDLAFEPDPVALQCRGCRLLVGPLRRLRGAADVFVRQNVENAGNRARRAQIHAADATASNRTRHQPSERRVGHGLVVGVQRLPRHFGEAVDAQRGAARWGFVDQTSQISRTPACRSARASVRRPNSVLNARSPGALASANAACAAS